MASPDSIGNFVMMFHGADFVPVDPRIKLAVKEGNVLEVKRLIDEGVDIKQVDEVGFTLLHHAAVIGNIEIIEILLNNGADIRSCGYLEYTPLFVAINYDKFEVIELFQKKGVGIDDAMGRSRGTMLHAAILMNMPIIVEKLLKLGANVKAVDSVGNTPLHYAYSLEICQMLVFRGADIYAVNKHGKTPYDLSNLSHPSVKNFYDLQKDVLEIKEPCDE